MPARKTMFCDVETPNGRRLASGRRRLRYGWKMPLIQSVERALAILDLFNEQETELKITEISQKTGLHKSTLHSLLKTLQSLGYIEQAGPNAPYRLGMKLFERGFLVLKTKDFVSVARPHLERLASETGQTVHLGVQDGKSAVYIDKIEGARSIIAYSRIGRRMPLHSTALGKVLVAFLPKQAAEATLADYDFEAVTEATISNRGAFLVELARVREAGWAIDDQENVRGVRCAAVPVWNHERRLVAAVSASTIVENIDDGEFTTLVERLRKAGEWISRDLGYTNN